MVRALVLTHGGIGVELVKVVEMIMGPVEGLDAGTNHGKSAPDLGKEVQQWLGSSDEPAIVLVDDYAGSCATCSQVAISENSDTAVICGVNLAMLLGFVTWRETFELDDLAGRLVRKGREAITLIGGN